MSDVSLKSGICGRRLDASQYLTNFDDLHPPLGAHEAQVEAERCYFCFDAPCTIACPTEIDIPLFIRQISTGNATGSAETIFTQNIMGGMCARVCPTETLCEQACVREEAEGKPVKIGQLQRFATDIAMENNHQFFSRKVSTGKNVAVIGAGPAGLACAHGLAMQGHSVQVFEGREKPGGLNEFGIAAYKSVDNFARREVDYITAIGGIEITYQKSLGKGLELSKLIDDFDAVFLGIGLGTTGNLGIEGENLDGVDDAITFIEKLRQAKDYGAIPIGRKVVVIGGGMTAIDAAVQAKHLGAEEVTICYRRGQEQMAASTYEQELATANGVAIRHWLQPTKIVGNQDGVAQVEFNYTSLSNGTLENSGETAILDVDQIFKAIGQSFDSDVLQEELENAGIELVNNRISAEETGKTRHPKIWAGGDCVSGGDDLTVSAVAMGRDAAKHMHQTLADGEK